MRLKPIQKKSVNLVFLIFALTFLFSCKKQDSQFKQAKSENSTKQINSEKRLKGLTAFLNILGLDKRLKGSISTENYHYFSKSEADQLWIISLEPGTYGFTKAKIAASLKDGQFSMIIVSYNYDTTLYKKGDFSTYTGSTSIYNQKIKKLTDFVYERGILKKVKASNCTTCLLFIPSNPPPDNTNWCAVLPALCDYSGSPNTSNSPTMLTMNPDDGGSGGGSGGSGSTGTTSTEFDPNITNNDPDVYWWDDNTTTYPSQSLPTWANMFANYPKDANGNDMPSPQVYSLVGVKYFSCIIPILVCM